MIIGVLGTITYSIKVNKPELNKITAVLIIFRSYMAFLDIEDRRHINTELYNSIFLVGALNGLGI